MDIFSHAVAGACSGAVFGHPILGAACAVAPDLVLGIKRRAEPNVLYRLTHSVMLITIVGLVHMMSGYDETYLWAAQLAVISHLVLDLPTHGVHWSPQLLYPFLREPLVWGEEWEWFNESWWFGLSLTIIWSSVCLSLS